VASAVVINVSRSDPLRAEIDHRFSPIDVLYMSTRIGSNATSLLSIRMVWPGLRSDLYSHTGLFRFCGRLR
jgi:hypothetical protein